MQRLAIGAIGSVGVGFEGGGYQGRGVEVRVGGFTYAHLSVCLPRNFTSKHLAQELFGVVWLTILRASVCKDGETRRV